MKKQILISLISVSSVLTMNAQIYTPSGTIQGSSGNNNVGIGITSPQSVLHIAGNQNITWSDIYTSNGLAGTGLVTIGDKGGNGSLFINTPSHWSVYPAGLGIDGSYDATKRLSTINIKACGVNYLSWSSNLVFHTSNGTSLTEAMRIDANGNIGIGTIPAYKLDVNGTIHTKEVIVNLEFPAADYVFDNGYKLRTLTEVKNFIKINKHLPEIPSASEIKQNGLNMAEMQNKLLQKIEELTLYTIQQSEKIKILEEKVEKLEKAK